MAIYAATKKANEMMAHSYSNLFNLPTTGTVIIEYPIEKWIELEYVSGKVKLMKFPKQI